MTYTELHRQYVTRLQVRKIQKKISETHPGVACGGTWDLPVPFEGFVACRAYFRSFVAVLQILATA